MIERTVDSHHGALDHILAQCRYTFHLESCGASSVQLAAKSVINNDGMHMLCRSTGTVAVTGSGYLQIEVRAPSFRRSQWW